MLRMHWNWLPCCVYGKWRLSLHNSFQSKFAHLNKYNSFWCTFRGELMCNLPWHLHKIQAKVNITATTVWKRAIMSFSCLTFWRFKIVCYHLLWRTSIPTSNLKCIWWLRWCNGRTDIGISVHFSYIFLFLRNAWNQQQQNRYPLFSLLSKSIKCLKITYGIWMQCKPLCSQSGKKQINSPEAEHVAFKLLVIRALKHCRKQ